jgi:hypothetical protein
MSLKLAPSDCHGWSEVVRIAVFIRDILDEKHEQDVVLVLAGIHAAAQFIARGPEGGVEVGFLYGHDLILYLLTIIFTGLAAHAHLKRIIFGRKYNRSGHERCSRLY